MKKKLFSRVGIALAASATLALLAGTAQAAGIAPVPRATNAVVYDGPTVTEAQTMYGPTGLAGVALTFHVYFTAGAQTATPAQFQIIDAGADGLQVNTGTIATPAEDDLQIYTDNGTTKTLIPAGQLSGIAFTSNLATAAQAIAVVTVNPSGIDAFRVNAGNLEYSANTLANPVVFIPVKVAILKAATAANEIEAIDTPAATTPIAASIAGQNAIAGVAPTPKLLTHSSATVAGGVTIDGLTIDTLTPIAAGSLTATTNYTVAAVPGTCPSSTIVAGNITAGSVGAVATAPATANTVLFPTPATVTWTATPATDAAAYSTDCFNTGVQGVAVPFAVTLVAGSEPAYTSVVVPDTNVAVKMAALPGNAVITDGAQIVIVSAGTANVVGTTEDLTLTFSEAVTLFGGVVGALREVAENVLAGGDSLAALNLNSGGTLSLSPPTVTNGQGQVTISGVQVSDISGKTLTVNAGIALQEPNDTGFSATTPALDIPAGTGPDGVALNGGLWAVTGGGNPPVLRAPSIGGAGLTIGVAKPTIAFGGDDTGAVAFPTLADNTKIGTVVVTFKAGKKIALNATATPPATTTDLANNLVITVNGLAGKDPVQFQFHPVAAQLLITPAGDLVLTLPTVLIYSKIDILTTMAVEYLAAGVTAKVLVSSTDSTVVVSQAGPGASLNVDSSSPGTPGTEPVILPLSATKVTDTLITQSVTGAITPATGSPDVNGSRITAYLAALLDISPTSPLASFAGFPIDAVDFVTIKSGNVTNASDKVGSNLALEFVDKGNLENLITQQLNNATTAQAAVPGVSNAVPAGKTNLITVYVKLIRSNDPTANGSGNSTDGQVYLNGRALMASTYANAKNATGAGQASGDNLDPIYEVQLNPSTGAITGRLTGNLVIWVSKSNGLRGLVFVAPNGEIDSGPVPVGQAIVGATGYNLLLGVDPHNDLPGCAFDNVTTGPGVPPCPTGFQGTNFNALKNLGLFVLLVHEQPGADSKFTLLTSADPSAKNYMPFSPNLLTGSGARTTFDAALGNYVKMPVVPSNSWALYGPGNPSRQAVPKGTTWSFGSGLVGLDPNGVPKSFWIGDGDTQDLAMTMSSNKMLVATEVSPTGATLSTIASGFGVPGTVAFAWANDIAGVNGEHIDVLQAGAVGGKVGAGWSLVTVPAAGLSTANIDAIIRVGAQLDATGAAQQTWIKLTDGAPPTLTPGEAVFVFSAKGGAI